VSVTGHPSSKKKKDKLQLTSSEVHSYIQEVNPVFLTSEQ